MIKFCIFLVGVSVCLTTACSKAQTQEHSGKPSVLVVPPRETSSAPSLVPATTSTLATPESTVPTGRLPIPEAATRPATDASPAGSSAPAKLSYNSCRVADQSIAMTFDDGPHPQLTPKLLDLLKERNIKATFFVIGKNVEAYPEIAKRIVEEGHEIASHTWNHPALNKLSPAKVQQEVESTRLVIEKATGVRPRLIRPPYGATNAALNRRLTDEFGERVILWSVDPLDWKHRNQQRVFSQILEKTRPGDIVLSHDIHPTTVAAMPATLDALREKGFTFVTVSELLAKDIAPVEVARKDAPVPTP